MRQLDGQHKEAQPLAMRKLTKEKLFLAQVGTGHLEKGVRGVTKAVHGVPGVHAGIKGLQNVL